MMRLRTGKLSGAGCEPVGQLADDGAASQYLGVFPSASRHRRRSRLHRWCVRRVRLHHCGRWHRCRPPADNGQALCRQVTAEALGHLRAVKRWSARADNADARRVQNAGVAVDLKHSRRALNLQQGLRIFEFLPVHQFAADAADGVKFLFGTPKALLLENRLSRRRGRRRRASPIREAAGHTAAQRCPVSSL